MTIGTRRKDYVNVFQDVEEKNNHQKDMCFFPIKIT